MIFPCNQGVNCPDDSSPTYGISSEAADGPTFISTNFGRAQVIPPLDSVWSQARGFAFGASTIDQATADAQAQAGQLVDQVQCGTPDGGCWEQAEVYFNSPQVIEQVCADGLPFNLTIPAGTFAATDPLTANLIASNPESEFAQMYPMCLSGINGTLQEGGAYDLSITITGGVAPYTVNVVSGTFPPGATLGLVGGTIMIFGPLADLGTYTFTFQVQDSTGAYMQKTYTLTLPMPWSQLVWGIPSTSGTFSNVSFAGNSFGFGLSHHGVNPASEVSNTGTMQYSSDAAVSATMTVAWTNSMAAGDVSGSLYLQVNLGPNANGTPILLAQYLGVSNASGSYTFTFTVPAGTAQYISVYVSGYTSYTNSTSAFQFTAQLS